MYINKDVICFIGSPKVIQDIKDFIEKERHKHFQPNKKNMGALTYIDQYLNIAKNTWSNIEKTGVITSTAMQKMLLNKEFLAMMLSKGYVKDMTDDLF